MIQDVTGKRHVGMFEEPELTPSTKAVVQSGRGGRTRLRAVGPDATDTGPHETWVKPRHPLPPKHFDHEGVHPHNRPSDSLKRAAARHGAVKSDDLW